MRYHERTVPAGFVRRLEFGAKPHRAILALCCDYNAATSPYTLRTDREHKRCRQQAKAIRNRLRRMGALLRETESGLISPLDF